MKVMSEAGNEIVKGSEKQDTPLATTPTPQLTGWLTKEWDVRKS